MLISLSLPRQIVGSTTLVVVVALVSFAIGSMLLAGVLNGGPPSAFFLVIAGANVLISFGA